MTETRETRLKRLKIRSRRRGMREMDLILGGFADVELGAFDEAELAAFEALLEENDQELYAWVSKQTAPAATYTGLIARIQRYHNIA